MHFPAAVPGDAIGTTSPRARNLQLVQTVLAGLAGMLAYLCVYAFRKPFAATTYSGEHFLGFDYKVWLVIAEVCGYTSSKFIGIHVISGMRRMGRARFMLQLMGVAALSLLGFALAPQPWNLVFLFLNSLPLGLAWGVLFSYLEGRRYTEIMGAFMACSMIFSSGLVKSIGRWYLLLGVGEYWMPLLTGLSFVPLLLACLWLLEKQPPPDEADRAARGERHAMSTQERRRFALRFLPGIVLIVLCYVGLTVVRDFRDSFEIELFTELGYGHRVALFTQIETPIAVLVLLCTASLVTIHDNVRALMAVHAMMLAGVAMAGIATLAFRASLLPPLWWLGLTGFGLYLAYIPFSCAFEERLLASFRGSGNVGFMMYICDAFGYTGSVIVIIGRELVRTQISWVRFFSDCVLGLSTLGLASVALAAWYFWRQVQRGASVQEASC